MLGQAVTTHVAISYFTQQTHDAGYDDYTDLLVLPLGLIHGASAAGRPSHGLPVRGCRPTAARANLQGAGEGGERLREGRVSIDEARQEGYGAPATLHKRTDRVRPSARTEHGVNRLGGGVAIWTTRGSATSSSKRPAAEGASVRLERRSPLPCFLEEARRQPHNEHGAAVRGPPQRQAPPAEDAIVRADRACEGVGSPETEMTARSPDVDPIEDGV